MSGASEYVPEGFEETKSDPVLAPKVGKSKRLFARAESVAEEAVGGLSLPTVVAVEYYRGVTNKVEAAQLARAFIEANFDAPTASFFYIFPWREGLIVEMQQGGGRAFMPDAVKILDSGPDARAIVPMAGRVATVRFDTDIQSVEFLMLSQGEQPTDDYKCAVPGPSMTPFDQRGVGVLMIGYGWLAVSALALVVSAVSWFTAPNGVTRDLAQTAIEDLPIRQVGKIMAAAAAADCVAKIEFRGGTWMPPVPGRDVNGICIEGAPERKPAEPAAPMPPAEAGAVSPGGAVVPGVVPGGAVGVPPAVAPGATPPVAANAPMPLPGPPAPAASGPVNPAGQAPVSPFAGVQPPAPAPAR